MTELLIQIQRHQREIASFLTGAFITWLLVHPRIKTISSVFAERLNAEKARYQEEREQAYNLMKENKLLQSKNATLIKNQTELVVRMQEQKKAAEAREALLKDAEYRLENTFKALSADALKSSQEQFLTLANNNYLREQEKVKHDSVKRQNAVEQLVKPITETLNRVQKHLSESEQRRENNHASLKQQIIHITESNQHLKLETHKLVKALRQPHGRGQWGEMQLRRVVEMAGMQEHCDFETQTNLTTDDGRRLRPDLVVNLPGGRHVIVDSKAPMDAYLDAIETDDETQQATALARHAKQVRRHIQQLASKNYQQQFETTPEFVVLFLPSEAFFSAALTEDPTLIEKGVEQGVILATPTTLIALLRAVAFGWRQETLTQNAQEIAQVGKELYLRLGAFADHIHKLGRSLSSAVSDYNKTVGSFETRILSGARKFKTLGATPESEDLPEHLGIEEMPREMNRND